MMESYVLVEEHKVQVLEQNVLWNVCWPKRGK
jgi:hypothetical protein